MPGEAAMPVNFMADAPLRRAVEPPPPRPLVRASRRPAGARAPRAAPAASPPAARARAASAPAAPHSRPRGTPRSWLASELAVHQLLQRPQRLALVVALGAHLDGGA